MGSRLQGVDRRVPAAEAVERDTDAEAAQRDQPLLQLVEGDPRVAVGHLDHQGAGGQPVPGEERLDGPRGQCAVQQPGGRHPYGDGDLVPGPGAVRGLLDGLLQQPGAQLGGALAVLGDAEELGGGEQDALGGAPPGLGGDGRDRAAGQVDDGLVEQGELPVAQGRAEAGGELGAAHDVRLHLRGVQLDPVLAMRPSRGTSRGRRCA